MLFVSKLIAVTEQGAAAVHHLLKTMPRKLGFKSKETTNQGQINKYIYSSNLFFQLICTCTERPMKIL